MKPLGSKGNTIYEFLINRNPQTQYINFYYLYLLPQNDLGRGGGNESSKLVATVMMVIHRTERLHHPL